MDAESLAAIDASRERLRALVERLSDEELAREVDEEWTVAALLAHTAFWDRRAAGLVRRFLAGAPAAGHVDTEAVNRAALPQWRALPPQFAAQDALAAAEEIDGVVVGLTPDLVAAIRDGDSGIRFDRSRHRNEHIDQIERALGRS